MSDAQSRPEPQTKSDPGAATRTTPGTDPMAVFSKSTPATTEPPRSIGLEKTAGTSTEPTKPVEVTKAVNRPEPSDTKDEMRDLVLAMAKLAPGLSKGDPELARNLQALAKEVQGPGKTEETVFRTRVAYALQDVEKQSGSITVTSEVRDEMVRRAASYPLLDNAKMKDLLAQTGTLAVENLVREIRKEAVGLAAKADQNTPSAMDRISVLENRVRLSPRIAEISPGQQQTQDATQPATASPATTTPTQKSARVEHREQGPEPASAARPTVKAGGVMLGIMNALRSQEPEAPGPWDRQLTPMGARLGAYTARMQDGAHEQTFRGAEASGHAALSAMREFSEGQGAGIMSKIRDAAKADPAGMSGVLSEMREGGKYADLRQTFNATLEKEMGVAAAYDRATSAVAKFGVDRTDVETIAQARPDAAAIAGRFQKLDADIGKAATMLPGKTDGKSFTDELAEKAQDIVKKAVEAVQSIFAKFRPSSGPSPS